MNDKGKAGEDFATKTLTAQGCEIIGRNYTSRYGEIDIIARDGDDICFIEVKARRKGSMVEAAQSVTPQKQKRIIKTAVVYMHENEFTVDLQPRFDVFCVETAGSGDKAKIIGYDHLKGAFDSEAYNGG